MFTLPSATCARQSQAFLHSTSSRTSPASTSRRNWPPPSSSSRSRKWLGHKPEEEICLVDWRRRRSSRSRRRTQGKGFPSAQWHCRRSAIQKAHFGRASRGRAAIWSLRDLYRKRKRAHSQAGLKPSGQVGENHNRISLLVENHIFNI